jgi:hypothetical protein
MKITNDTLLKTITLKGAVNCAAFEQTKSEQPIARTHNTGLASLIYNWQKWRFTAPQTHLLTVNLWFSVSSVIFDAASRCGEKRYLR